MGAPVRDTGERKRHGRHYTPPELADFLARRVLAHLPEPGPGRTLRILDPACGDGELLLALHRAAARLAPGLRFAATGYDLDRSALDRARTRAAAEHIDVGWHCGDFLTSATALEEQRYDAIITNPPYVRVQQLGADTARLLSREFGLRGRIDLTHPFVALAPRLLRPGGVLGLLCANRFLTTKAGANIRTVLLRELPPVEIYDLGDTKLFTAAVLPAVTIAVHAGAHVLCRHVSAYESPHEHPSSSADLFDALLADTSSLVVRNGRTYAIEVGTLAAGVPARSNPPARSPNRPEITDAAWRMSSPEREAWLAGIGDRTWRTVGEVAPVRVGIKTNADKVFIAEDWERRTPCPEPELLRALLTHRDLRPWRVERAANTRVLYPYDAGIARRTPIDLDEFPSAARYLRAHHKTLAARAYLADSGRQWFEIWVPQRPDRWRQPKIVFPDISERARFALDRSGAVVNGDCYWISLADLDGAAHAAEQLAYLLMGVANSALGLRFYDAVCGNRLYSGRRRWITQYVSRLPLPDPGGEPARRITAMVADLVEGGCEADESAGQLLDELVVAAFGVG
ncbi:Eco57I restriction-modification methylase domain-containing protein [Nocardia higoensis]|uniref:Eco57I restriction-modification methylase domain-containing protein n=1 Tax=Nocardia higoensis TaxID=228599 RepID=UPI0002E84BCB|nr:N-6 DNA methylase [Nocardia higoensis]